MRYAEDYLAAGFDVMLYSPDGITPRGPWLRPGHVGMVFAEMNATIVLRYPHALVVTIPRNREESVDDLLRRLETSNGERFTHVIVGSANCKILLSRPAGYFLSAASQHRLLPLTFTSSDVTAPPSFEKNAGLKRLTWRDTPDGLPSEPGPALVKELEAAFVLQKSMSHSGNMTTPVY